MKWGVASLMLMAATMSWADKKPKALPPPSPLDQFIRESLKRGAPPNNGGPGSLWGPSAQLGNLAGDLRATRVDDVVTILVSEQANALASGNTKTSRQSSAQSAITAAGGVTRAAGPWANLAKTNTQTQLQGQGTTSRQSLITTTLAARVTDVLPNGFLVIEGDKNVQVNSENQVVKVRGVIRSVDIQPGNTIPSNEVAQLEVRINGKGVVNDAVRRPFFLYRLLLGLLPF